MAKTIWEKMFWKSEYSAAVLHAPKDLKNELSSAKLYTSLKSTHNFILAFYSKKEEVESEITKLKNALLSNSLLWIAYPKNKALATDLNRDILHELMKKHGLDGVSLVSLNETWSAMRFKLL